MSKLPILERSAIRKPNEIMRLIVVTIVGLVFGFFIGISFPTVSITKHSTFLHGVDAPNGELLPVVKPSYLAWRAFSSPVSPFFLYVQFVADRGLELLSATFMFSVLVGSTLHLTISFPIWCEHMLLPWKLRKERRNLQRRAKQYKKLTERRRCIAPTVHFAI